MDIEDIVTDIKHPLRVITEGTKVRIECEAEIRTIDAYDLSGRRIASTSQNELDLANTGLYILRILTTRGEQHSVKVVLTMR